MKKIPVTCSDPVCRMLCLIITPQPWRLKPETFCKLSLKSIFSFTALGRKIQFLLLNMFFLFIVQWLPLGSFILLDLELQWLIPVDHLYWSEISQYWRNLGIWTETVGEKKECVNFTPPSSPGGKIKHNTFNWSGCEQGALWYGSLDTALHCGK